MTLENFAFIEPGKQFPKKGGHEDASAVLCRYVLSHVQPTPSFEVPGTQ
jgi:hypothetical protein